MAEGSDCERVDLSEVADPLVTGVRQCSRWRSLPDSSTSNLLCGS